MATLMIQGTTSDAGKSTVVAGLCRVLKRRGISVAPFKPQNMALNSAVTTDGGEIGRSTALQAQAAGVAPHSDMNPVLLKPSTDRGAQVILRGRPYGYMDALSYHASHYHAFKRTAQRSVMDAWRALSACFDVIIAEGAGSPAEINLREGDIANMGFAEAVDCPVLLVGDIDRGGVFAQLVGTLALLSESEQARTRGFIINRFRGDIDLLTPGLEWLEARTDKPVLGTLPYIQGLLLDAEDGIATGQTDKRGEPFQVAVIALPRISNHTDFDPLRAHPQVNVTFVGPGRPISPADVIVLPGSQSVISDLDWLKQQGFAGAIQRHLRYGGKVLGIGGGQQMLGEWLDLPGEAENAVARVPGLGLLPITSRLTTEPPRFIGPRDVPFATEGTVSEDGQVLGTGLHGLFEHPDTCSALLGRLGLENAEDVDYRAHRERELERLADTLEQQLDMDAVMALLGLS